MVCTESQLHRRENGAGRMASGWHQDGIRMAVRRATPTRWHTELERAKESRTTTGHGLGEVWLAGHQLGPHCTGCDTNDSAMRTRFARQSTEGADG